MKTKVGTFCPFMLKDKWFHRFSTIYDDPLFTVTRDSISCRSVDVLPSERVSPIVSVHISKGSQDFCRSVVTNSVCAPGTC